MTDLFNSFSIEYLGALKNLSGVMDVIYAGQLSPAWGIRGVSLRKFHEVLPHFLYVQI